MNTHTRIETAEFMAAMKALIKLNVDNETTIGRIQQLFVSRRPKVGIMLITAQRHDYENFQKQQQKKAK